MKGKKFCNQLKNQKGITAADITISLLIILVSVSVIGMVYTNLVITSSGVDRKAEATRIATNIIENISSLYYDSIEDELDNESEDFAIKTVSGNSTIYSITNGTGNETLFGITIPNSYETTITFSNVYASEDAVTGHDLVKKVTVEIKYLLNNIEESVSLEKIFVKEALRECNSPIFDNNSFENFGASLENSIYWYENATDFDGDYIICPVKYDGGTKEYKLVSESEIKNNQIWYSYSNRQWARVLLLTPEEFESSVDTQNYLILDRTLLKTSKCLLWIPKFGIDTNGDLYFKYQNKDNLAILNKYYDQTPSSFLYYYIDLEDSVSWSGSYALNFGTKNGKWVSYTELSTSGTECYWLNQSKYGPLVED